MTKFDSRRNFILYLTWSLFMNKVISIVVRSTWGIIILRLSTPTEEINWTRNWVESDFDVLELLALSLRDNHVSPNTNGLSISSFTEMLDHISPPRYNREKKIHGIKGSVLFLRLTFPYPLISLLGPNIWTTIGSFQKNILLLLHYCTSNNISSSLDLW